jgi:hypothetical protein
MICFTTKILFRGYLVIYVLVLGQLPQLPLLINHNIFHLGFSYLYQFSVICGTRVCRATVVRVPVTPTRESRVYRATVVRVPVTVTSGSRVYLATVVRVPVTVTSGSRQTTQEYTTCYRVQVVIITNLSSYLMGYL